MCNQTLTSYPFRAPRLRVRRPSAVRAREYVLRTAWAGVTGKGRQTSHRLSAKKNCSDANNRVCLASQDDLAADDAWIGCELPPPEGVADNGDWPPDIVLKLDISITLHYKVITPYKVMAPFKKRHALDRCDPYVSSSSFRP